MKYFFIAGEASGDLHASNLIKEIHNNDSEAEIRGLGGELMEAAGMKLLRHYREMAFMGFIPVLMNLDKIKQNFKLCEEGIKEFMPDVLVLIDYPSFNLKMAEFAKKLGIKVYYYISPKVWVWKKGRIKKMKKLIDEMFTIFPFETEFFAKYGIKVNYVGNPVLDAVIARKSNQTPDEFRAENMLSEKPILALVPGSRMQEINSLLPRMLEATKDVDTHQLVVTTAPNISKEVYNKYLKSYNAKLLHDRTYETIQMADFAIVASGTVTLETAILNCPQIVCYKMGGGAFLYYAGKWFVGIRLISLVNIILKRMAVPEIIQHHCTAANIRKEVRRFIDDPTTKKEILDSYDELSTQLGNGTASKQAAELMVSKLTKKPSY